jgi:DNA-binding LacI/PurR family transcriptional regulator/PAS domain-containing protein
VTKRKTIGVYAPYLQGFFFGELISQIQQYCLLKNYSFTVIKTGGFGEFKSTLHSRHIDYVIILRNAIHIDLAQTLMTRGKTLVSIAYDYFPLNIPVITSDNDLGMELAFNHLMKMGHREIAFVGDLSQYDIRKRYEAFCDQYEINGFELKDTNVFAINDTLFSGGYQAAREFVVRNCQAKGVICGASLTSIGFAQQLKCLTGEIKGPDIVGFDAISLIPITEADMAMIDQNLHLMAYKAINILEQQDNGDIDQHHHFVEPKLITPATDFMQSRDAFLATSTEMLELHNANYMKSVISNLEEWPKNIADNNLDTLMTLKPLFEKYMQKAYYGRAAISRDGREFIKILKTFTITQVIETSRDDTSSLSESEIYPNETTKALEEKLDFSVHIPIFHNLQLWSVLSIFGSTAISKQLSSLSGFFAYLDNITNHLRLKIQSIPTANIAEEKSNAHSRYSEISGKIKWQPTNHEAEWDKNALRAIGLTSELEINIYKNMDLPDRIHPDDDNQLRSCLLSAAETPFIIEIRLKHKNKNYVPFQLERGEVSNDGNIHLLLTQLNSDG